MRLKQLTEPRAEHAVEDFAADLQHPKEAFARRRCLVPAAAYYEWRHDPSGKTLSLTPRWA